MCLNSNHYDALYPQHCEGQDIDNIVKFDIDF